MNKTNKQYLGVLFAVAVVLTAPVYAIDNQYDNVVEQEIETSETQEPVVWYKKESTQKIVSAAILAAITAYVIAVRMNKVSSPLALCAALCGSQVAKNSIAHSSTDEPKEDTMENKSHEVKPQSDAHQPAPQEPVHFKIEVSFSETEKLEKLSEVEKPATQMDQQLVEIQKESLVVRSVNPAHNFIGEEIQLPQVVKNLWKAMTQPRSDSDLLHVH
jgi:hypothetical protein